MASIALLTLLYGGPDGPRLAFSVSRLAFDDWRLAFAV